MNYINHGQALHSATSEEARNRAEHLWASHRPKLEVRNVISILISAEFLKMPKLIDECVRFVVEHLHEIVQLPIDLNCLSSSMAKKLAKFIQLDELEKLKDKKDRLQSRLFKKKLEIYFEDDTNMLYCCAFCDVLFTRKSTPTRCSLFLFALQASNSSG